MTYKRKFMAGSTNVTQAKKAKVQKATKAIITGPYRRAPRLYRPEVKIKDSIGGTTATNAIAGRITLVDIDEGMGYAERLGDWITVVGLEAKFDLRWNTLNAGSGSFVRLVVVQDLEQQNNFLTSLSEVIQGDYLSAYNHKTTGRFKVYMDKLVNCSPNTKESSVVTANIKTDFGVQYDGDIGTNLTKNGFYFFYVGSDGSNGPLLNWNLRLKYIDS